MEHESDSDTSYKWCTRYSEKFDEYQVFAKDLEKPRNMNVITIHSLHGSLGMISKNIQKRLGKLLIRGRINIIQTTALFKSARILRRVLEI